MRYYTVKCSYTGVLVLDFFVVVVGIGFFFFGKQKKATFPSSNQIDFIDLNSQSNAIKSLELNFQAIDRTSVKFY